MLRNFNGNSAGGSYHRHSFLYSFKNIQIVSQTMTDFYDFIDTFPEGVAILDNSLKIKKYNEIFAQICSEDQHNVLQNILVLF